MATQSPISTVSYNSELFLREKLDGLRDSHIVASYQYIRHVGEDGDKDHIHLRIVPNRRIDPMDLSELLKEPDPKNPKPLGVMDWRPSKEEDWLLYAAHDPEYMKLKYPGGQKGEKIPYDWKVIQVSDDWMLEHAWVRAQSYMLHTSPRLMAEMRSGVSQVELIERGESPFAVFSVARALYHDEYAKTVNELELYKKRLDLLVDELERIGFVVEYDEGSGRPKLTGTRWELVDVNTLHF